MKRPDSAGRSVRRLLPLIATGAILATATIVVSTGSAGAEPYPWSSDVDVDLLEFPTNHSPAPTVVDWNDDGLDDLVVGFRSASQFGGIGVALRQPDGGLAPMTGVFDSGDVSSLNGFTLYARPTVGDWDGDGDHDLLFGTYYGTEGVGFCPNVGTSSDPEIHGADCSYVLTESGAVAGRTSGSFVAYVSPELTDWDDDGDLDLLVGTGSDAADLVEKGVRLYENIGGGAAPEVTDPIWVVRKGVTPGLAFENYYEPTIVDIDDDGLDDLLIAGSLISASDRTFVLRECLDTGSGATPSFESCSFQFVSGLVNNVVDADDWDDDGYLDLVRGFMSGFITNPVTLLHGQAPDSDGDGLSDSFDNCVDVPNPAEVRLDRDNLVQIDTDRDAAGDACDPDDDGDVVDDVTDNCPLTPNADQSDVDGDGSGDACDPTDDRPAQPGAGTYEAQQADRIDWGRRPVIVQRADAMSIGYRQEIAEALTDEALERGLAFTLAVIPWDTDRFAAAPGSAYLNRVIDDPNFEVAQHGTYHTCVYEPYVVANGPSAAEFDCDMDVASSYNLMRVGYDALVDTVDFDRASHDLTGFVPPTDAFDAAAGEAMRALGYDWVASAWYVEQPRFVYTDADGLVHLPWSQIACGNGAASWTDCQRTDTLGLASHSGVDCDDPTVCTPTRDGKDYDDWQQYADTSLADRCRADFDRYGVCSVLYELTSYDADFSLGVLDPVAFAGYQQTLSELEALADDTGAVFMTLGDYAAALRADDPNPPEIVVTGPVADDYGYEESFVVDVDVTDDISGVHDVSIMLDGEPVVDGQRIDLADATLGQHVLAVVAEDVAGNVSRSEVVFTVVDRVPPEIVVHSPRAESYGHADIVPIDVDVTDAKSGVDRVVITLDGSPVVDGSDLDLLDLSLGTHTLLVVATDRSGNEATRSVTFEVEATIGSLIAAVERFVDDGAIADSGTARSLLRKLDAARAAVARGADEAAHNQLRAFVNEVRALPSTLMSVDAATLLITDAIAVGSGLGPD